MSHPIHFTFAATLALCACATASPIVIQPDEPLSKDTFVYEFLPTFNFNSGGFAAILTSGKTTSGHDTRTFIQFDLSGATLDPGEIATLNLFVGSTASAGFGVNPSPAAPVLADVHAVTGTWDEDTLNWGNQPAFDPTPLTSTLIDNINQSVSFDVTGLVQTWLANPASNFGFAVVQPEAVNNAGPVVAVYDSASAANKPFLQIVPEPAIVSWLAAAGVLLAMRRRAEV